MYLYVYATGPTTFSGPVVIHRRNTTHLEIFATTYMFNFRCCLYIITCTCIQLFDCQIFSYNYEPCMFVKLLHVYTSTKCQKKLLFRKNLTRNRSIRAIYGTSLPQTLRIFHSTVYEVSSDLGKYRTAAGQYC